MGSPRKPISRHTTDRLALALFEIACDLPRDDQVALFNALVADTFEASGPRVRLAVWSLERCQEETGKAVSKRLYTSWRANHPDRQSLPSASFIANTFDNSWARALDAAGMQPAAIHADYRLRALGPPKSTESLLRNLRRCASALGSETLTFPQYERWARKQHRKGDRAVAVSVGPFRSRFGSFAGAMVAAGLRPALTRGAQGSWEEYTPERKRDALRRAQQSLLPSCKPVTIAGYDRWRQGELKRQADHRAGAVIAGSSSIVMEFGSWSEALASAGVLDRDVAASAVRGQARTFSGERLAAALLSAMNETGGSLTRREYEGWRRERLRERRGVQVPASNLISRRAGGWERARALTRLGLTSKGGVKMLARELEAR